MCLELFAFNSNKVISMLILLSSSSGDALEKLENYSQSQFSITSSLLARSHVYKPEHTAERNQFFCSSSPSSLVSSLLHNPLSLFIAIECGEEQLPLLKPPHGWSEANGAHVRIFIMKENK